MEKTAALLNDLRELFSSQKLAVLSTQDHGQPYGSLVAFAATDDLKTLMFATTRATRKYANIGSDARVAMVIDNRSNEERDFNQALAVTAVGEAAEAGEPERQGLLRTYLAKHPYLKEFVASPSCAFLKITVSKYSLVTRFQDVREFLVER